jgi:methylglutaconyl-CoA hydratase
MRFKNLSVSLDCHVAWVELNRPPVNAFHQEFISELLSLTRLFQREESIWVVAVRSSQKVFCAGADLKERASHPQAKVAAVVKRIQTMVHAWYKVPQPVLMQIHGAALGGGLEFALAGDILIASEDAQLGFPEVQLGIIPAAGGTQLLMRRTNPGVAKKWILTGKKFSALEAYNDGVVDIVVPAAEVSVEFSRIVKSIASQAPLALRQAKKAISKGMGLTLGKALAVESECYAPLIRTQDRAEALQAFLEKRRPVWRNK